MPELPEVETVAAELHARLPGRRIEGVEALWPRTIGHPSVEEFGAALAGLRVQSVSRRAKYVVIQVGSAEPTRSREARLKETHPGEGEFAETHCADGARLLVHLRMTGRITIEPASTPRDPYTRLALRLDGGDELRFADTRKFGRWYLLQPGEEAPMPSFAALGPEPLEPEFTPEVFAGRVAARRGNVKGALLDQRLVAGLGNIYADEALFRAHIHPRRTLQSLRPAEIAALHEAIVTVLQRAVERGGTSFSDYRTTWGLLGGYQEELSVFRKGAAPCPACGTPIERDVIAGRGTHYCPRCQM